MLYLYPGASTLWTETIIPNHINRNISFLLALKNVLSSYLALFRFTVPPPVIASDENNKPCLEKENTDNHVNQTTTDSASSSVNGGNMGTKDLIHGYGKTLSTIGLNIL